MGAAGGREEDEGRLGKAGRQRGQLAGWAVVAGTSWEELLESSRGGGGTLGEHLEGAGGAPVAEGVLDGGCALRPARDSLRCPGRTTEPREHPSFRATHPKARVSHLFSVSFSFLETSLKAGGFGGRPNAVRRCARQLSPSRAAALGTLLYVTREK